MKSRQVQHTGMVYIVVALHGSPNKLDPIFGGYQIPANKAKPAFCVYDNQKRIYVWISCPHIDYISFQKKVLDFGLNETEAKFKNSIYDLQGEGNSRNMKQLTANETVEIVAAKV